MKTLRILAATDLSEPSQNALARAFQLAAQTGSELHVVYAIEGNVLDALRELVGAELSMKQSMLVADARKRLAEVVTVLSLEYGVTSHAEVVEGSVVDVIEREANRIGAKLVVVGNRGASFVRNAVLGSTARRLLRHAGTRSVLVVKALPRKPYASALVAIDFSRVSYTQIEQAKYWARPKNWALVHAVELPYESLLWRAGIDPEKIGQFIHTQEQSRRSQLHALAAEAGLAHADYEVEAAHDEATRMLLDAQERRASDLVVIGKHGANRAEDVVIGNVAARVLNESTCDVLVVCDEREKETSLA